MNLSASPPPTCSPAPPLPRPACQAEAKDDHNQNSRLPAIQQSAGSPSFICQQPKSLQGHLLQEMFSICSFSPLALNAFISPGQGLPSRLTGFHQLPQCVQWALALGEGSGSQLDLRPFSSLCI